MLKSSNWLMLIFGCLATAAGFFIIGEVIGNHQPLWYLSFAIPYLLFGAWAIWNGSWRIGYKARYSESKQVTEKQRCQGKYGDHVFTWFWMIPAGRYPARLLEMTEYKGHPLAIVEIIVDGVLHVSPWQPYEFPFDPQEIAELEVVGKFGDFDDKGNTHWDSKFHPKPKAASPSSE